MPAANQSKSPRSPQQRRRRALVATGIVALALAIPACIFWFMATSESATAFNLSIPVPEFLYQDVDGQPVSKFDLEGHITLVAVMPEHFDSRVAFQDLQGFLERRLIFDNGTERSPIRLIALTPHKRDDLDSSWRQIIGPVEAGVLIPSTASATDAGLAIIDQTPSIRYWQAIDVGSSAKPDFSKLEPTLSRQVINHYMRDYLAKRTFFRREPKPAADTNQNPSH